ncbi:Glutamate gated chloride channel alpha subunit [Trichostrongylus colubriformis]|uniref:Glutamate gated chloride channel alpha subunit n=1 Tax=Trichostrongylus colubriformis TaxID=6319 RepID=A0AAN8F665_TRICO
MRRAITCTLVHFILVFGSWFATSTSDAASQTAPTSPPKIKAQEIMGVLVNSSYDKRIRPSNRDSTGRNGPVVVNVNTYIRSMSNIDFVRMQYNVQITFRQFWRDPRLAYGDMFPGNNVPKFIIITEKGLIWTPDTFFLNEKQAHRHEIDKLNLMIRVHANGSVMYSERLSLTLSCPMYLHKYPMDEQNCHMLLASYAFTTDDIVYRWDEQNPIQYHAQLNTSLPNFSLDSADTGECTSSTTTGEYSCIKAMFTMKRMFRYYLAQIYLPSTLLVVVSWVSFWLERTAVPARVTLGVTTLLTMTTQAAAINNSLPPVSYIKAVDVWVGACLAFIFAAVLEFAIVSYCASLNHGQCQKCEKVAVETPKKEKSPVCREETWCADKQPELAPLQPSGVNRPSKYCLPFWQKWKMGADPPKMIDLKSRIMFPICFILFNILYWTWYSFL